MDVMAGMRARETVVGRWVVEVIIVGVIMDGVVIIVGGERVVWDGVSCWVVLGLGVGV